MARPIKATDKNINVFQSYILTTAKYKFSVYEKRIIYRLVETAQSEIIEKTQGQPLKYHLRSLGDSIFGDKEFLMGTSCIIDIFENDANNYTRVKNAFYSLQEKRMVCKNKEGNDVSVQLVGRVETSQKGYVKFMIFREFWAAIMDFAKGFRKYELLTAMKLKSPYSMRFYELVSGQTNPFTLTIEQMREMFGLENKYAQPASIKKRIIEPSKKELDESAPYSFNVKETRMGRGKTSPITAFTFIPYRIEDNQDKDLQRAERASKLTGSNFLNQNSNYVLTKVFNWNLTVLRKNKITIKRGEEVIPNFQLFLLSLKDQNGYKKACREGNPIGYVVQSVKNRINEIIEGKDTRQTRHTKRSETAIQREQMDYDDTETW